MGLSLEFYAGDRDAILAAIQECDMDGLDEPGVVSAYADLSLHLVPRDLDLLSQAFGIATGRDPIDLGPHLTAAIDEEGYGALEVSRTWVQYVASADLDRTDEVAHRWTERMSAQYHVPVQVNEDIQNAIPALISLCQSALKSSAAVIHVWYL